MKERKPRPFKTTKVQEYETIEVTLKTKNGPRTIKITRAVQAVDLDNDQSSKEE